MIYVTYILDIDIYSQCAFAQWHIHAHLDIGHIVGACYKSVPPVFTYRLSEYLNTNAPHIMW